MACDSMCAAGYFATGANVECELCPTYTYAPHLGSNLTNCTCDPGYTGADGVMCAPCIAGTYKYINGSSACLECVSGKYSTEVGEVAEATCSMCPAHAFSPRGSNNITNCWCNTGYTGPLGGPCVACQAGFYKNSNGSVACSSCSRFTVSPVASEQEEQCICDAGYSSNRSSNVSWQCIACVPGTWKAINGTALCTECQRGKYSDHANASSEAICTLCPSHSFTGREGSDEIEACTCNLGFTGLNGGNCSACAAGKYKDVNGTALCTVCVGGKYSTHIAPISEATCSICPNKTFSRDGSNMLTNCTCLHGYDGPDGAACSACVPGWLQSVAVYCSMLQRVAACCSLLQLHAAVCCSLLQLVAACCSV